MVSIAAAQARKFYEQVVRTGRVFTFLESGSLLVFPMPDGDVVPFWSSESRLTKVQEVHPKYRAFERDQAPQLAGVDLLLSNSVMRRP